MALFQVITSETQSSSRSRSTNLQPIDAVSSSTSIEQNQNSSDESSNNESSDNYEVQTSQGPIDVLLKKRKRINKFRELIPVHDDEEEDEEEDCEGSEDGDSTDSANSHDREFDEDIFSEVNLPVEQFTSPDFNDHDESDNNPNINANLDDSWILLSIFKFQARFRLPE